MRKIQWYAPEHAPIVPDGFQFVGYRVELLESVNERETDRLRAALIAFEWILKDNYELRTIASDGNNGIYCTANVDNGEWKEWRWLESDELFDLAKYRKELEQNNETTN